MSWTREEILLATGGDMVRRGKEAVFGEVVTDSSKVEKGSIFIALKGERFDGHAFLRDALSRGASCLVVHKRLVVSHLKNATLVKVRDTLEALGNMAHYRRKMVAPRVLAITGSNGKTTTKEMVAAILERASIQESSPRGRVLKTEGNYNNLVGLPLTLLRLQGRERVAVLELGTSRPGEIRRLTQIANPDIGLITSIAPAHLTEFNNLAGVAREKGELFRGIDPKGIAVVNLDDPWVRRLGEKFKGEKITYGRKGEVTGESWKALGVRGMEFTLRVGRERRRIRLRLSGEHNLSNAVAAAAMAYGLGADLEAVRRGLEAVKPFPMRMVLERWRGIGIINDAYNANPASMEAAIKTLAEIGGRREKVAILGDMLELGRESRKSHLELGKQVARYRTDRLYLLGEKADQVKEGALLAGMEEERVIIGKDHKEIAWLVRGQVRRGDWLLFKGSRGMNMERALGAFKEMGD
ncbi:MAG: UDP-N-acetylmuramoyl-tripeptide--D-alanyl-D-alanine ligase [Deltaproteobacteria bacterium]|nr:UDP-N-acetylmuramoyl-tripeptide--D-alanyl-D-alanine ligase [Deltaproteobacteria bacterium]